MSSECATASDEASFRLIRSTGPVHLSSPSSKHQLPPFPDRMSISFIHLHLYKLLFSSRITFPKILLHVKSWENKSKWDCLPSARPCLCILGSDASGSRSLRSLPIKKKNCQRKKNWLNLVHVHFNTVYFYTIFRTYENPKALPVNIERHYGEVESSSRNIPWSHLVARNDAPF